LKHAALKISILILASLMLTGGIPATAHASAPHRPKRLAHTRAVVSVEPRLTRMTHGPVGAADSGNHGTGTWLAMTLTGSAGRATDVPVAFSQSGRAPPFGLLRS
jgi:hypothetical protein